MAIKFTGGKPETKTFTLLEPGEYSFEVTNCKPDTTMDGLDFINVTLRHESGTHVFDRLFLTEKAAWKIQQFAAACGQDPESGSLDDEAAIGKTISARIKIEKGKKKNESENYPDRNQVEAYIFETGDEI